MPDQETALADLRAYRAMAGRRDPIVRAAEAAGINIRQISLESGISRQTIYRILGGSGKLAAVEPQDVPHGRKGMR